MALQIYDEIKSRFDYKILVIGRSLGCYFASFLTNARKCEGGLICISPLHQS